MALKIDISAKTVNLLRSHVHQGLFSARSHSSLDDDDGSGDIFLLHSFAVGADGFDTDLGLVWEENEHLVGGIVIVSHEDNEIVPGRLLFARFIAKLLFELIQRLVQLVLCNLLVKNTQISNDTCKH